MPFGEVSTIYLIMEWLIKMSKLPLPPTLTRGFAFVSNTDMWFAPLPTFVLFLLFVHCVKNIAFSSSSLQSNSKYYSFCLSFRHPFHLPGLKMTKLKHQGVKLGFKFFVVALLLFFKRNNEEGETDNEGALRFIQFFCFHSFRVFLFDVMCWGLILPVQGVRVVDIGFYFVPMRKVKLTTKVR